ncbi:DUF4355 domain-containing protein [Thermophilibacter provencensis]|uniref:DUF4355 domain-containing protein n=1 Tax=Thermophilibacter provencensis TaxID=1852386 RepID=UPI002941BC44|nr:DUF4355 domain-containing protein [Thermophilibacter provencensis]
MAEIEGAAQAQQDERGAQDEQSREQEREREPKGRRTYTDEEVDAIIERRFAKWQKQQDQKVAEAAKLAEMNATQKAEYEREQALKKLAEYERRDAVRQMTDESRRQLREAGVDVPDEVVTVLVGEDAEATKAAVDGFAEAFKAAVEAEVKRRLAGGSPRVGGDAGSMTAEQILAIKDPMARQRAIRENISKFRQ